MRRFPIYVNGQIALARITQALTDAGFNVRCDLNGMMVVDEIPSLVRHDPPKDNVTTLRKGKRA